jgi:hypothetical protein
LSKEVKEANTLCVSVSGNLREMQSVHLELYIEHPRIYMYENQYASRTSHTSKRMALTSPFTALPKKKEILQSEFIKTILIHR